MLVRGGRVYLITAQTSSLVDFSRNSSHLARFALRMTSRRSRLALWNPFCQPSSLLLFLQSALPRALLFSRISSFHHLLDLAQTVIRLVPWFKVSMRVAWIQSISASRSASELVSSRMGLQGAWGSGPLALRSQTVWSLRMCFPLLAASFSFCSCSLMAQPWNLQLSGPFGSGSSHLQ